MKQVYIENFRDAELFVTEEEQFHEKGKLEVVHCLKLLLSHISGKLQIQGTVVSVLKKILNPKVLYVRGFLLPFVVMSSALMHFLHFTKDLSALESMKAELFLSYWKQKSLFGLFFFLLVM